MTLVMAFLRSFSSILFIYFFLNSYHCLFVFVTPSNPSCHKNLFITVFQQFNEFKVYQVQGSFKVGNERFDSKESQQNHIAHQAKRNQIFAVIIILLLLKFSQTQSYRKS